MPKQTIYNVGIYVRLSKDDERAGESLSIENQKLILTKYVTEQGWNITDIYVDDDLTLRNILNFLTYKIIQSILPTNLQ